MINVEVFALSDESTEKYHFNLRILYLALQNVMVNFSSLFSYLGLHHYIFGSVSLLLHSLPAAAGSCFQCKSSKK